MIGRADIEGSKSDVAMNAWPPQASYPCGNFSDTITLKLKLLQIKLDSFCLYTLLEVSVLNELTLGHLRYLLIDVPPQSNYLSQTFFIS
ncbi:hypothetical protein MLD38_040443 [Melastoma candidum]|nr:hypothetical protein MLD38_040443 [Melastoma candidum]